MDNIITITLSIVSAAIGAGITAFFAYNNDVRKSILEKQREAYLEFINALQSVMNNDNDSTKRLLDARNKVIVYGSNETLKAVDNYIIDVIGENQKLGTMPTQETHEAAQTLIIKSIRKDLKLNSSEYQLSEEKTELEKIILIRYDNQESKDANKMGINYNYKNEVLISPSKSKQ